VRIFADTFYWVALLNRRDSANRAVLEFSRTLGSSTLITTDEVLIELLAFCASDQQLRMEAALTFRAGRLPGDIPFNVTRRPSRIMFRLTRDAIRATVQYDSRV
jgi:hypothetical protein